MIALGITGHQEREGLDWAFAEDQIVKILAGIATPFVGLSSLAVGADQLFARAVLSHGGQLTAVIPAHDYETSFEGPDLITYRELLSRSTAVELPPAKGDENAFYSAGRWIVDHCDELIAVWDGQSAEGLGGTADVIAYAISRGRPCLHIDPFRRIVRQLKTQ